MDGHRPDDVVAIGVGTSITCGLAKDGAVYCFGSLFQGGLGDGEISESDTPVRVAIPAAVRLAVGTFHACAVTGSGHVYCWGQNMGGQLGNGSVLPIYLDQSSSCW